MFKHLSRLLVVLMIPAAAWGQSYRIGGVEIGGLNRVEQGVVRAVIGVQPGQTATLDDIDRDLHQIYQLGRFTDVSAEIRESQGATILTYRVVERPLIRELGFAGNKEFKEDKLREKAAFKTPDLYDPRKVDKSLQAIKKAYVDEGYHAVVITPQLEPKNDGEAQLTFTIVEGDKVLVDRIRFQGNAAFSDRQLKKAMETKERWFLSWLTDRGTYKEEVLQIDLEAIADKYFNNGYVQVKVRQPQITLVEDNRYMDILIDIEEGLQFRVGQVEVQGDLLKPPGEILALTKLKPGDIFSREKLRGDLAAINSLYADQGYAYVNVAPLSNIDPQRREVDLKYEIEQGIQVHIDRIRVVGNTKTRDKVIRREMKLVEGDLYSASKLKESRRRVNNLGFFEEVNVTTAKGPEADRMDLDVSVKEKPTGTFSIGFGYSSVDQFIAQGSVSQSNFLGKALKLNLSGAIGGSSTTYQVGLLDPYFLDKNLSLGGDLYKTDREWSDFSKKATGGDVKLGFPVGENTRAFFIYRYEVKTIYDVEPTASQSILDQAGTSTLSSLFSSLTHDTTDYRIDPSSGGVSEVSIELAGLGGTENFARYILDHRHFWPWKWGTVFSLHGQLGYLQQIGDDEVPIDERFYLGGIRTLRGFKSREVGPRVRRISSVVDPVTGAPTSTGSDFEFTGGDKEAVFNLEYTFPLVKDLGLKGVLFFDAGNAWGEDEEFFSEMRYSVGGGIRWFSPMGPLRLEWGYNLDPKEFEEPSQFEFSIGNFF